MTLSTSSGGLCDTKTIGVFAGTGWVQETILLDDLTGTCALNLINGLRIDISSTEASLDPSLDKLEICTPCSGCIDPPANSDCNNPQAVGVNCSLTCDPGQTPIGGDIQCLLTMDPTDHNDTCDFVNDACCECDQCDDPTPIGLPAGASLKCAPSATPHKLATTCGLECGDNYEQKGSSATCTKVNTCPGTCGFDTMPCCKCTKCAEASPSSAPSGGSLTGDCDANSTLLSTCNVNCPVGSSLVGPDSQCTTDTPACSDTCTWTDAPCCACNTCSSVAPKDTNGIPANHGTNCAALTPTGQTCETLCPTGSYQVGANSTCSGGATCGNPCQWSTPPCCRCDRCTAAAPVPANGIGSQTGDCDANSATSSTCVTTCPAGYTKSGTDSTCTNDDPNSALCDGSCGWDPPPVCTCNGCPVAALSGASTTCTGPLHPSDPGSGGTANQCELVCETGYRLVDSSARYTCTAMNNGADCVWSGEPVCELIPVTVCDGGTTFGRITDEFDDRSHCFSEHGFSRWGWHTVLSPGVTDLNFTLYAGAAHCTKLTNPVGDVVVTYDGDTVDVCIYLDAGHGIDDGSIWIGTEEFPTVGGRKKKPSVAPGQYNHVISGPPIGASQWCRDDLAVAGQTGGDDIYIIIHVNVCDLV